MFHYPLSRKTIAVAGVFAGLLALLLLARPAAAGSWVVVTLDELPGPVRAGDTLRVGFIVRQHGVRPINSVSPVLTAVNPETGETITAEAEQVGATGHFEATVVLPEAGAWAWQITVPPFPRESRFEPLTVLPAAPAGDGPLSFVAAGAGEARAAMRWAGALLLAAAAVLTLISRRRREAVAARSTA